MLNPRLHFLGQPLRTIKRLEPFLREPSKPLVLALSRPDERKNILTLLETFGESQALRQAANLLIVAGSRDDIRALHQQILDHDPMVRRHTQITVRRDRPQRAGADAHRPQVRHQAGRGKAEATRAAYQAYAVGAEVSEFVDDMAAAYRWADLVICRAGALTIAGRDSDRVAETRELGRDRPADESAAAENADPAFSCRNRHWLSAT